MNKKTVDEIAEAMRGNVPPWRAALGFPSNAFTSRPYSGLNVPVLALSALRKGYKSHWWATHQQWVWLGATVMSRPSTVPEGQWGTRIIRPDGVSILFNAQQVFGPDVVKWKSVAIPAKTEYNGAEEVLSATKAEIKVGNFKNPRYERPPKDRICLPWRKRFTSDRQWYATNFHELIHWAEWRTGWDGDEEKGELVAEIGQCYIESLLGLPHCDDMTNHNKFVGRWIKSMSEDPKYIYEAVAQAEKAVDFILGYKGGRE